MYDNRLNIIGAFITDQIKAELKAQGHVNTGELYNSIKHEVKQTSTGYELNIYANDYAKYMENGFGKGKWVSVYALAEWVEQKGIATGEKEIKSVAFAIRRAIYNEGSPTKGAFAFSSNGRRKDFVSYTMEVINKDIEERLFDIFTDDFTTKLSNFITYANNQE